MMSSFFLSCLLLLPTALLSAGTPHIKNGPIYIAAVGDSLTEGFGVNSCNSYPALLEKELKQEKYDCIVQNYGISGEVSSQTLIRLHTILLTKPDLLILEIGINDALNEIPIETIRSNISRIIEHAKAEKVEVILIGVKTIWSWDRKYANDFNTLFREIAEQYKLPLIPSMLEGVAAIPAMTLPDTIHPNEEGYRQVLNNVLPTIKLWLDNYFSGLASGSDSSSPR